MGLAMAAVAKLSLNGATQMGVTPVVGVLLWPFVLKFSFSLWPINDGCINMMHGLRLFLFQMGRIAVDSNRATVAGGGGRWPRALRLVCQRIANAHRTQFGDDSLIHVSMLAL